MTKNKIILSTLVAAIVSTSAMATTGTGSFIVPALGGQHIAKELESASSSASGQISMQDFNMTINMDAPSATEPNLIVEFNGGADANVTITDASGNAIDTSKLVVQRGDTNGTVATYAGINGNNQMVFNAASGTQFDNTRSYFFRDSDTNQSDINVSVNNNITNATFELWDNPGSSMLSTATTGNNTYTPQFTDCTISTALNGLFDADQGFKKFKTGTSYESNATRDRMTLRLTNRSGLDRLIDSDNELKVTMTTTDDVNLTALVSAVDADAAVINDKNITFDLNASAGSNTYNIDFDLNGTVAQMSKINFVTTVSYNTGSTTGTLLDNSCKQDKSNVWGIYGYYAQIPNVVQNVNKNSYINIVNTNNTQSGYPIFEILPEVSGLDGTVSGAMNGNTCTVTSDRTLNSNSTNNYSVSDILSLAADSGNANCAGIDATQKMAIEVRVPINPDDIYVNAKTTKTSDGKIIVLPVYNTSEISY